MFDVFGEFNTIEELNRKAEELKAEGKKEDIVRLATENGFEQYVADMFLDGEIPVLCPDPEDGALAKLAVEQKDLQTDGVIKDWVAYIEAQCIGNMAMARAVRKKKKSLRGCLAGLLVYALTHQRPVDKKILEMAEKSIKKDKIDLKKQAGMEPGWLQYTKVGIMDMGTAKDLIRKYYLGEE